MALGLAVPGVMLVVWLLQRHIVAKPQPSLEPDLLRADDAVRASSVHLLSGTGLAVGLILIALQLVSIGQLLVGDVGTPVGAAGLLLLVAALFAWRYYGHRAWVVRRTDLEAAP